MGIWWVGGYQENSTSFDTHEKLVKNTSLRGLKLRGIRQNQMSTPHFMSENYHGNNINISGKRFNSAVPGLPYF